MFNAPQKAEEEAQKAKEEEAKRKKKEEERARRRARGLEDEEEQDKEEGKKEGEEDEDQKEDEQPEEEQHREPGEIIRGFYYRKHDKFWVSMVSLNLLVQRKLKYVDVVLSGHTGQTVSNMVERKKCFPMFEKMLGVAQILSNTIQHDQTRCPSGKMFGHQTVFNRV